MKLITLDEFKKSKIYEKLDDHIQNKLIMSNLDVVLHGDSYVIFKHNEKSLGFIKDKIESYTDFSNFKMKNSVIIELNLFISSKDIISYFNKNITDSVILFSKPFGFSDDIEITNSNIYCDNSIDIGINTKITNTKITTSSIRLTLNNSIITDSKIFGDSVLKILNSKIIGCDFKCDDNIIINECNLNRTQVINYEFSDDDVKIASEYIKINMSDVEINKTLITNITNKIQDITNSYFFNCNVIFNDVSPKISNINSTDSFFMNSVIINDIMIVLLNDCIKKLDKITENKINAIDRDDYDEEELESIEFGLSKNKIILHINSGYIVGVNEEDMSQEDFILPYNFDKTIKSLFKNSKSLEFEVPTSVTKNNIIKLLQQNNERFLSDKTDEISHIRTFEGKSYFTSDSNITEIKQMKLMVSQDNIESDNSYYNFYIIGRDIYISEVNTDNSKSNTFLFATLENEFKKGCIIMNREDESYTMEKLTTFFESPQFLICKDVILRGKLNVKTQDYNETDSIFMFQNGNIFITTSEFLHLIDMTESVPQIFHKFSMKNLGSYTSQCNFIGEYDESKIPLNSKDKVFISDEITGDVTFSHNYHYILTSNHLFLIWGDVNKEIITTLYGEFI